jgi:isoleucyl-tRNA synthetase
MARAERIVTLVRAMRMKSNLKVRQPLKRIIVPVTSEKEQEQTRKMEGVILEEINVKAIEYVTDESGIVRKSAKANFKSIGPKFGKSVQQVAQAIKQLTAAQIRQLETTGTLEITANGSTCTLAPSDVEIVREDIPGWLVESEGGLTVALDTALTDELIAEGFAREFVNRIQNMRKDAGFQVTDRIAIAYSGSDSARRAIAQMSTYVQNETLAVALTETFAAGEFSATIEVNGEEIQTGIERRPQR